jgi:quinol monooxygenase YgiN
MGNLLLVPGSRYRRCGPVAIPRAGIQPGRTTMFVVIVKAKVKPDKVSIYESTFKALRKIVLEREPGVTFYELCRVPGEPCCYRVIECYADQAAQDVHLAADYYQQAGPVIVDCLVGATYEMETVETV